VQVLFRTFAHEVAQNETLPLRLIRTRQPYVDLEPVSAAPLSPGDGRDFRIIFDRVSPDWDGAYPEIRVLRVETKQGAAQ
jgi:adenosylcobinamide amidohydrolase